MTPTPQWPTPQWPTPQWPTPQWPTPARWAVEVARAAATPLSPEEVDQLTLLMAKLTGTLIPQPAGEAR